MKSEDERYYEIKDSIPKDLKLRLLTKLVSGLVASGHFTTESDEKSDEYRQQLKIQWLEIEKGKPEWAPTVIVTAERLLEQIIISTYAEEIYSEQETPSNNPDSA